MVKGVVDAVIFCCYKKCLEMNEEIIRINGKRLYTAAIHNKQIARNIRCRQSLYRKSHEFPSKRIFYQQSS